MPSPPGPLSHAAGEGEKAADAPTAIAPDDQGIPPLPQRREPGTRLRVAPGGEGRSRGEGRLQPFLRALAPGGLAAVLLTLAFPKTNLWWLAWVSLAPWYAALSNRPAAAPATRKPRWVLPGFAVGFWFGLSLHLVGMFWMTALSPGPAGAVPWVVLSIIEAGWFAVMGVIAMALLPRLPAGARPWTFAALWTCLEFARSWGKCAFPWFLLAATQARAESPIPHAVVQVVSLTGQWGLSFAVAAVGALAVEAWRARTKPTRFGFAALAIALPLALFLFGTAELSRSGGDTAQPTRTVAVAQGNIQKIPHVEGESDEDARRRWEEYKLTTLDTYARLTRTAAESHPVFILWPETVAPGYLLRDPQLEAQIVSLARETRTPLLVGTADADFFSKQKWNSTVYYDAGGLQRARYDKARLVPMGEFFLFSDLLGPIYQQYGWREGDDFTPGTLPGVFPVGGYGSDKRTDIGMLICYESVFPDMSRDRVRHGAQLLVQMTSDQTFDGTPNPQQHADLAILRAIETRRYFVRAGATGLSEIIDPFGHILKRLPSGVAGTFSGEVHLRSDQTFFVRYGDWFVGLCALGVAGAYVVVMVITAPTTRRKPDESGERVGP